MLQNFKHKKENFNKQNVKNLIDLIKKNVSNFELLEEVNEQIIEYSYINNNLELIKNIPFDFFLNNCHNFKPNIIIFYLENNDLSNEKIIKIVEKTKNKSVLIQFNKFFTETNNFELLKLLNQKNILTNKIIIEKYKDFPLNISWDYIVENIEKYTINPHAKVHFLKEFYNTNSHCKDVINQNMNYIRSTIINIEDFYWEFKDFINIQEMSKNPYLTENILKQIPEINPKFVKIKLSEEYVMENYKRLNLEDIISINNYSEEFHIKFMEKLNEKEKKDYFTIVLVRKSNLNFISLNKIMKHFNIKIVSAEAIILVMFDTTDEFLNMQLNKFDINLKKENNDNLKIDELKSNFMKKRLEKTNLSEEFIIKHYDYIKNNFYLLETLLKHQQVPEKLFFDLVQINNFKETKIYIEKVNVEIYNYNMKLFFTKQNIFTNNNFENLKKTFHHISNEKNLNEWISQNNYFNEKNTTFNINNINSHNYSWVESSLISLNNINKIKNDSNLTNMKNINNDSYNNITF